MMHKRNVLRITKSAWSTTRRREPSPTSTNPSPSRALKRPLRNSSKRGRKNLHANSPSRPAADTGRFQTLGAAESEERQIPEALRGLAKDPPCSTDIDRVPSRRDEHDWAIDRRHAWTKHLGLERRGSIAHRRKIGVVVDRHQPQWGVSRVARQRERDVMRLRGARLGVESRTGPAVRLTWIDVEGHVDRR